jgi:hypothetical protein
MKEQTAVEWLKELWDKQEPFEKFIQPEQFEQAKQMEKKQIINAVYNAMEFDRIVEAAEKYYNKTYGK